MANYIPISTVTIGSGGSAAINFIGIPQTYTDLVIKVSARTAYTAGSYGDGLNITFNGSTTGYTNKFIQGYDSTASGSGATNQNTGLIPDDAAAQTTNVFSNNEITIPNYTSSSYKGFLSDNVVEKNGTTNWVASMYAILWSNTAPITSINLTSSNASTFNQYSTATLYGIRKY
jgi:hypothetical protein